MAQLLKHERDLVAFCPVCGSLCEQLYLHEAIVTDDQDRLCAAKCFQCTHCGSSYHRDFEPREGLTDLDLNRIIDRREWSKTRSAAMRETIRKENAGRYKIVDVRVARG